MQIAELPIMFDRYCHGFWLIQFFSEPTNPIAEGTDTSLIKEAFIHLNFKKYTDGVEDDRANRTVKVYVVSCFIC